MGVVFEEADDVASCLVPFVQAQNPWIPREAVETSYGVLTLGRITTAEFWRRMGLLENSDAAYLGSLRLDPTFFADVRRWPHDLTVGMISNDAAEWSSELRRRYGLTTILKVAAISGECGFRKPDEAIYRRFLEMANVAPADCLLIDDSVWNLVVARRLGFRVARFQRGGGDSWDGVSVSSFAELTKLVIQVQ